MREIIGESVSVVSLYDHRRRRFTPKKLSWNGREYPLTREGFHHPVREGRRLYHIFSMSDGATSFRLKLDSETLIWTLEEISDGLSD